MKRIGGLALALTLVVAAAPPPRRSLPLPPIPPAHTPTDGAAPTPNRDAAARTLSSDGTRLTAEFVQVPNHRGTYDRNRGYTSEPRRSLPLPPIPPAHAPTDGAAPTPDRDASGPSAPSSDGPRLIAEFVQVPTYHGTFDRSQGYTNGSRLREDQSNRRLTLSPGLTLELPFK
jgi:hypothetical protein